MARHRLVQVDTERRKGVCTECGIVDLHSNGVYKNVRYWSCAVWNRERARARGADEKSENARMLRKYGVTLDDFARMLAEQGGRCARCDTPAADLKVRLSVDHCHRTGAVRKLLCPPCNTYLGKLETHRHRLEQDLLYLDTGLFEPVPINN